MGDSGGERQSTHALRLEKELSRYQERLRELFGVGAAYRVLDIGCGAGATTRDAARSAPEGSVHGVDVAAPVIETARRLAAEEGVPNATFEQADAQSHPFPPAHFDLAISRFGTMFFADPVAAFTNIGRALRPGARLVQLVWQDADRQEWAEWADAIKPPSDGTTSLDGSPFSLGDPRNFHEILTAAGFTGIEVTELSEPIDYGTQAEAYDFVLGMSRDLFEELEPAEVPAAHDRLRAVLAAHDTGDGVWFGSRAWFVTAHR
ncbi:ubiquinone/menaquinone biosynthesis C-methylase UbiE [Amycolatopsis lexingtonensis]|uniref:Ubiquinone/menaquinone biosynthesis C-methylase UbiE n=1 Tax=Amycolatopsis lexingtonensis TaxID=218822 RepID=A0ABR9IF86_9PSEU|nr:class I SAM-dependent methyltransferase [Amycolatopsis lexingtonensis]MBE1501831.1 ubiquinone/menaquinone biosynthesis C-methylase UbiE [Amycolatopsis lexingtonensis]